MLFQSTRHGQSAVTLSAALAQGLAADGGLYVPAEWPQLAPAADPEELPALALELLRPFAAGESLAAELPQIVR